MVISVASPLLIGIYENGKLIEEIKREGKTSEILPVLFEDILRRYDLSSLFYAKGPGSFMAIKISYIFLKTLSIIRDIPLLAADAFHFNENSPIKAVGKLYFVKENGIIRTKKSEYKDLKEFSLPEILDREIFESDFEPLYILPAV